MNKDKSQAWHDGYNDYANDTKSKYAGTQPFRSAKYRKDYVAGWNQAAIEDASKCNQRGQK